MNLLRILVVSRTGHVRCIRSYGFNLPHEFIPHTSIFLQETQFQYLIILQFTTSCEKASSMFRESFLLIMYKLPSPCCKQNHQREGSYHTFLLGFLFVVGAMIAHCYCPCLRKLQYGVTNYPETDCILEMIETSTGQIG